MSGRDEIMWAPRVIKSLIRRLYESDAKGLLDEELVDDVGTRLYLRCESILTASEAAVGRVKCPRCAREGRATIIRRHGGGDPDEAIKCEVCSWVVTWREYKRTYQHKQLTRGGAGEYFEAFLERYPKARTSARKMIEIDQLIHQFHWNVMHKGGPEVPTRAACVNFIEGRLTEVVVFLNGLSAGIGPDRRKTHEAWRGTLESIPPWHPR